MRRWHNAVAAALFAGALSVSACSTTVKVPPPPPRAEVKPAPPWRDAVWVKGHWKHHKGGWVWVAGRWEKPRAGRTWVDGHWEKRGGRWVRVKGHWR